MKRKAKSTHRSTNKRRGAPKIIDEYLARVPEPARGTLQKMRAAIRSALPHEAEETISYRISAFRHKPVLVWFAAFIDHCSFFPAGRVIEEFRDEQQRYRLSKGTIQFPIDKPLPAALVKRMVKARLAQVEKKSR